MQRFGPISMSVGSGGIRMYRVHQCDDRQEHKGQDAVASARSGVGRGKPGEDLWVMHRSEDGDLECVMEA